MKALVIEGGGMKAAFANGVLSAFEAAGHHPWDAVYGTSAGGALAAWYSAGQARFAEATWRYVLDPRIVSLRRALLLRGPLLDHRALLEVVYRREHPLDVDSVRRARWPVIVTAADVEAGCCVYPDLREGQVLEWVEATGRLPYGAGPAVSVGARRYVDGGVLDPIPVQRAVEDGATDITLVLNALPDPRRRDPRLLTELAARRYPALREGLVEHQARKAAAVAYARRPPPGVRVRIVAPAVPTGLTRMSRDVLRIEAAVEAGRHAAQAVLPPDGGTRLRPP